MSHRVVRLTRIVIAAALLAAMCVLCACARQSASTSGEASSASSDEAAQAEDTATATLSSSSTSSAGSSQTPVQAHRALRVSGTQIVDEHGEAFQIRGISTHGLAWYPQYVNEPAFSTWQGWGANTVRLALYTEESGGWCATDDAGRAGLLDTLETGVSAATDAGMYVIIDWHILSDGNPATNEEAAKAFFAQISALYAGQDNVIYEICNEPNGSTSWDDIYAYANDVIPVIRANSPDALVIVGTPTWSQDVDKVAAKPLSYDNVVYALHFYAGTHKEDLRRKAQSALDSGTPLLVSEFGICDASGNGSVDVESADAWMDFLDSNGIGYVCWNLSNKDESSALVSSTCDKLDSWSDDELSDEGRWYKAHLLGTDVGANGAGTAALSSSTSSAEAAAASGSSQAAAGNQAVSGASGNLSITCKQDGSWESDGRSFSLWRVTVKNAGSSSVESWSATLRFGGDVEISDVWCADANVDGASVLLVPASYAQAIGAGESQDSVGLIVSSASQVSLESCEVSEA